MQDKHTVREPRTHRGRPLLKVAVVGAVTGFAAYAVHTGQDVTAAVTGAAALGYAGVEAARRLFTH